MLKKLKFFLLLGLLLTVVSVPAQAFSGAGQAASSLNYTQSADAAALGRMHVVTSTGAAAIVHNPADLILQRQNNFSMMHTELFEGIIQDFTGVSYQVNGLALGVAYQSLGVMGLEAYDPDGKYKGSFEIFEQGFNLAASREVLPEFAVGANLRIVRHRILDVTGLGYGLGFGMKWRVDENWTFGTMINNPVSKLYWDYGLTEKLPFSARVGVAYKWPEYNLKVMGEYLHEPGEKPLHIGVEKVYRDNLRFRAGLDGMTPTLGLGFRMERLEVDYAFALDQEFGKRQYLSLNWRY